MAILEINSVVKEYKKGQTGFRAVDNISFSVEEGEVVGFIGPNGAGKSTTIKMVTGLAAPTSGTVTVNGHDVVKERAQAIDAVGAIIENPDMYVEWSAVENLKYFAALRPRADKKQDANKIAQLFKLVGLEGREKDKVKKYSLGMKQRLGIAQALLNEPKLLVLDEPANGLDPNGIKEIRDIITRLAHEKGLGVLVSSHQLAEMQVTCDRFVIIDHGKIVATKTAEELRGNEHGSNGVTVLIGTDNTEGAKAIIKEKFGVDAAVKEGRIEVTTTVAISDITRELILGGVNITGVTQKAVSLEDVFMNITHSEQKDEAPVSGGEDK